MALANVAKQKAEEIEMELPSTSGTDDYDSEDSLSEEDVTDGSYSTGEERPDHDRKGDPRRRDDDTLRGADSLTHPPKPETSSSDQGHVPMKSRKSRKDVDAWHRAEERIDEAYRHGDAVDEGLLSGASGLAAIPGDIYTKVLADNPFGWDKPNVAGPSASHPRGVGDNVEEGEEEEREEGEETTTLKVVHFGMV
ncbi:uncharacterized protein LOC129265752 isoform X2 [Lytechinus pictus]|uniref:uncharacterized protein LOC129265752 isoform X2 n=1 Tax=Lytechinus pictus TaxID=7653 RepID=UPI0030B9DF43